MINSLIAVFTVLKESRYSPIFGTILALLIGIFVCASFLEQADKTTGGGNAVASNPNSTSTSTSSSVNDRNTNKKKKTSGGGGGDDDDECPICLSPPTGPVQLPSCHHIFCKQCIQEFRQRAFQGLYADACPLCRTPLQDCAEKAFIEAVVLLVRSDQQRIMDLQPDSPAGLALHKKLVMCLERCLSMDPKHVGALITLGELLSDQNPQRAMVLLQRSLALTTTSHDGDDHPAVFIALGRACKHLGKREDAMTYFRKAIAAGKRQKKNRILAAAHVQVAMLLVEDDQGNIPAAVHEYEAAMTINPDDISIPFNLGVTLEETDNEGCIQAFRVVLLKEPNFCPANVAIAKAYRRRIISNAQDNSFAAGMRRAEDVQYWLGALLRAKNGTSSNLLSPDELQYCDDEIQTIRRLFPKVWAVSQSTGESAMMQKI